jgi:hypothetical protein
MPNTLNQARKAFSIRSQVDTAGIREDTFMGKDFVVVPVVALVEGVVMGMNATVPELALAEEFGKVPEGWNGRPIVMNHPVVDNSAVSANSPSVLESYYMGFMFNTVVEEGKLKTEAWLDVARINDLGGEALSTLERIQNDTVVEVSTGLFTGIEETSGRFNARDYGAIWRDVMPDHLAFLSEGTIGACSIEDGCGTPRTNTAGAPRTLKTHSSALKWQECGCKHGGTQVPKDNTNPTPVVSDQHVETNTPELATLKSKDKDGNEIELSFNADRFSINSYPASMMDSDARKLVSTALQTTIGRGNYAYVLGITQEKVIYETYDYDDYSGYFTYQRSYAIGEDKTVTLSDDIERVVITSTVTPFKSDVSTPNVTANSGVPDMPDNNAPAPVTPESTTTTTDASTTSTPVTTEAAPTNTPAPVVANAAPKTVEQYLAEAPAELRGMLQEGLRLQGERKTAVIAALKSTNRCKFDDVQLNGMSLDVLESLAELANVPRYNGQNPGPSDVADLRDNGVPKPPRLIPEKAAS